MSCLAKSTEYHIVELGAERSKSIQNQHNIGVGITLHDGLNIMIERGGEGGHLSIPH